MNKNTLKAIAKRIKDGKTEFTIGKTHYYANPTRKTVIFYSEYVGGPQIIYFDDLPIQVGAE